MVVLYFQYQKHDSLFNIFNVIDENYHIFAYTSETGYDKEGDTKTRNNRNRVEISPINYLEDVRSKRSTRKGSREQRSA